MKKMNKTKPTDSYSIYIVWVVYLVIVLHNNQHIKYAWNVI